MRPRTQMGTCSEKDCSSRAFSKGLCQKHYRRQARNHPQRRPINHPPSPPLNPPETRQSESPAVFLTTSDLHKRKAKHQKNPQTQIWTFTEWHCECGHRFKNEIPLRAVWCVKCKDISGSMKPMEGVAFSEEPSEVGDSSL